MRTGLDWVELEAFFLAEPLTKRKREKRQCASRGLANIPCRSAPDTMRRFFPQPQAPRSISFGARSHSPYPEAIWGEALQLRGSVCPAVSCAPGHPSPARTRPELRAPSPVWPRKCHPAPRPPTSHTQINEIPLTPPEGTKSG